MEKAVKGPFLRYQRGGKASIPERGIVLKRTKTNKMAKFETKTKKKQMLFRKPRCPFAKKKN